MMKIRCHDYSQYGQACVEKTLREIRFNLHLGTFFYWYLF